MSTPTREATDKELERLYADFDRVTAERDALAMNLRFAEEGYISFAEECDKLQQRLTAADELNDLMRGLMQEFCDRVDRGEVRSKTTYAKFKAALSQTEEAPCKTCNGTRIVSDGAMYCSSGGIPFECGPIERVKDCPDCSKP